MVFHFDLTPRGAQLAVLIDEKGASLDPHEFAPVDALIKSATTQFITGPLNAISP